MANTPYVHAQVLVGNTPLLIHLTTQRSCGSGVPRLSWGRQVGQALPTLAVAIKLVVAFFTTRIAPRAFVG